MMSQPICGIDPGLDGGIAFAYPSTMDVEAYVMPTVKAGSKTKIWTSELRAILAKHNPSHVFVEQVGAMPGQGVTSMFTFGYGAGLLEGIMAGLQIPLVLVTPQRWMKEVLHGMPKGVGKSSVVFCQRLFPTVDLRRSDRASKPHTGKSDAIAIAMYGMTKCGPYTLSTN